MMKKVITIYWDEKMGESKIEFEKAYDSVFGVAKLDLRQDIISAIEEMDAEGMNDIKEMAEETK